MNINSNGMGALMSSAAPGQQSRPQVRDASHPSQANQARQTEPAAAEPASTQSFDVNGLVDNLWGFMQARLADAKASGASEQEMDKLWQSAEKGLKQGFGEAKDALNALGKMSEPLNDKIDQAYDRLTDTLANRDVNAQAPSVETEQASGAERHISLYQYQERTFELDVTTQEGDRISVRVLDSSEASASQRSGDGWSQTRWGSSQSNAFDLQIQGDLNDQERADLDVLLGDVNSLANEFYEGDLDVAWGQAQALSIQGSSLATMELGMRSVEAKGVAAYQQQAEPGTRLPPGLEPLKQYANELLSSQQEWRDRLQSDQGLMSALDNHPRNEGKLGDMVRDLLG